MITPAKILEELQNISPAQSDIESDGDESLDDGSDDDYLPQESSSSSSEASNESNTELPEEVPKPSTPIPGKFAKYLIELHCGERIMIPYYFSVIRKQYRYSEEGSCGKCQQKNK
jgi:hypothetical protein